MSDMKHHVKKQQKIEKNYKNNKQNYKKLQKNMLTAKQVQRILTFMISV